MTSTHQQGRDRLLEYNSCRPQVAQELKEQAESQDDPKSLKEYLEVVFDAYGVDHEESGEEKMILHPGEHLQTNFPELLEDGMTVTVDRDIALANDDIHYLTWEHPMLTGVVDMIVTSELGNTAFTALSLKGLDPGTVMVECLFVIDPLAPQALQCERYLESSMLRVLVANGKGDISDHLPHKLINQYNEIVNKKTSRQIIKKTREILVDLIQQAEESAKQQMTARVDAAKEQAASMLGAEIHRLQSLQAVNPNVSEEEVAHWQDKSDAVQQAFAAAVLRLDAARVIIIK